MLDHILENYSALPDAVKAAYLVACGAIFTALVAFLGVANAASIALRGVREGLSLNREKNRQDREVALKKDIYIQTCDGLSRVLSSLGRLEDLKKQEDLVSAYDLFYASALKLQLIGTLEVVDCVNFVRELVTSFHSETVERLTNRDAKEARYQELQREAEGIAAELKSDDPGAEAKARARAQEILAQLFQAGEDYVGVLIAITDWRNDTASARSEGVAKLMLAIRRDLGIDSDGPVYLASVMESAARRNVASRESVQRMIEEIRARSPLPGYPRLPDKAATVAARDRSEKNGT